MVSAIDFSLFSAPALWGQADPFTPSYITENHTAVRIEMLKPGDFLAMGALTCT